MKRVWMLLMAVAFAGSNAWAQQSNDNENKTAFWEYRLGLGLERFQDLKVSGVTMSGTSVPIGIYKGWQTEKRKSAIGLNLRPGVLTSPLNDQVELTSLALGLRYEQLRPVSANVPLFDQWYIGGAVDLRIQRVNNDKLGNSANNAVYSGGLSVVNHFERPIRLFKKEVKLTYTLSLALLNYAKEDNSFTFSVPQEALENGSFNTQDFENGLFEYGDIATVNKFNNIQSRIAIHFPPRKRASWTIAYDWQLVKYAKVTDYALTSAMHSLSIAYHLPKKKK